MTTSPDSIVEGRGRGLKGLRDLSGCMLKCVAALLQMACSMRASWLAVFDACMYYSVWSLFLSCGICLNMKECEETMLSAGQTKIIISLFGLETVTSHRSKLT